jgi:hypothetical protein
VQIDSADQVMIQATATTHQSKCFEIVTIDQVSAQLRAKSGERLET